MSVSCALTEALVVPIELIAIRAVAAAEEEGWSSVMVVVFSLTRLSWIVVVRVMVDDVSDKSCTEIPCLFRILTEKHFWIFVERR